MAESRIRLSEMIQTLREEMSEAVRKGKGKDLKFAVTEIELETEVVVERTAEGKIGAAWIFSAEATGTSGTRAAGFPLALGSRTHAA